MTFVENTSKWSTPKDRTKCFYLFCCLSTLVTFFKVLIKNGPNPGLVTLSKVNLFL